MAVSALVITFNCARNLIDSAIFASYIFSRLPKSSPPPDLVVLCLQEVAPIAYAFLGGPYLRPYLDNAERAVNLAAAAYDDATYVKLASENVGMTAILLFARREVARNVDEESILTAGIGVGLWQMGNKGAAGICMNYKSDQGVQESVTFISAHLAPMESACARRNQDWKSIAQGLVFEHEHDEPGEQRLEQTETTGLLSQPHIPQDTLKTRPCGPYEVSKHVFVGGDLNYRTASSGPAPSDLLLFPQPSEDESYPQHYWHLLSSDQLTAELKAKRTCQGFKEASIDFPPTYKYGETVRKKIQSGEIKAELMDEYSVGKKWDWATHRWPSWCDRVLYHGYNPGLTGDLKPKLYTSLPLMVTSDHRPVAFLVEIPGSRGTKADDESRPEIPFKINPRWKEDRAAARRKEIIVGVLALLTTTWEALWTLAALVLLIILLVSGSVYWRSRT